MAVLVGDKPDPAGGEHAEHGGGEAGLEVGERAKVVPDFPLKGCEVKLVLVARCIRRRWFLRACQLDARRAGQTEARTRFSRKNELLSASQA